MFTNWLFCCSNSLWSIIYCFFPALETKQEGHLDGSLPPWFYVLKMIEHPAYWSFHKNVQRTRVTLDLSIAPLQRKDNGVILPIIWGKIISKLAYYTQPHSQLSVWCNKDTFRYIHFQKVYLPSTLLSKVDGRCVPPKWGSELREWKAWDPANKGSTNTQQAKWTLRVDKRKNSDMS